MVAVPQVSIIVLLSYDTNALLTSESSLTAIVLHLLVSISCKNEASLPLTPARRGVQVIRININLQPIPYRYALGG